MGDDIVELGGGDETIAVRLDTSWIPPNQEAVYRDCLGSLLEAKVPFFQHVYPVEVTVSETLNTEL
jgi:hypothetical protein